MAGRGRVGVALSVGLVAAAALNVFSCGGGSNGAPLNASCSLNSDCDNPLICAFGKCHEECATSRDCVGMTGERCVKSGTEGVCQLPAESNCSSAPCQSGQICGTDLQCRMECTPSTATTSCSTGDYCLPSGPSDACYSPSTSADQPALIAAGIISLDGAILADGSTSGDAATTTSPEGGGGSDAKSGTDGTIEGDGTAAAPDSTGGSSDGGPSGNPCPSAQTQFGDVMVGDTNASFTSGVAVRGKNHVFIFSGYSATPDAGDGGVQNSVYVQAFDPSSGSSTGPAQPLFSPPGDANTIAVEGAGVAPNGEIALLYTFYTANAGITGGTMGPPAYVQNTVEAGLYIAFVDPSTEGGTGLAVSRTVQVETAAIYSQPHVIWSAASQAFVASWEYFGTNNWFLKVRKFLVGGSAAGGDTDVVPTDNGQDIPTQSDYEQGSIAASGNLFGSAYVNYASFGAMLTLLDNVGNEVGPVYRAGTTGGNSWVALGGIATGFVYLYDNGTNVTEVTVPTAVDAGVVGLPSDGGDAGFPTFNFPGANRAVGGRAVGDDMAGGVGAALLYGDGVSFGYVMSDGTSHVGPDSVISHAYAVGDRIEITTLAGSFSVSEYSAGEHLTRAAASGCQ